LDLGVRGNGIRECCVSKFWRHRSRSASALCFCCGKCAYSDLAFDGRWLRALQRYQFESSSGLDPGHERSHVRELNLAGDSHQHGYWFQLLSVAGKIVQALSATGGLRLDQMPLSLPPTQTPMADLKEINKSGLKSPGNQTSQCSSC
jgi:hypothetical protein